MSASLWSDDEEERSAAKRTEQSSGESLFGYSPMGKPQSKDKFHGLFGSEEESKNKLFPSSPLLSSKNSAKLNSLFGNDQEEGIVGKGSLSARKSSETLDVFANDEDDDDDDDIYAKKMSTTGSDKSKVDLFAEDEDDDIGDDIYNHFRSTTNDTKSNKSYKELYEKEVAKCTELELTVESLLEKVAHLEEELRKSSKAEDDQLKQSKEASRQLRQKNRQKLHSTRQKTKKLTSESMQNINKEADESPQNDTNEEVSVEEKKEINVEDSNVASVSSKIFQATDKDDSTESDDENILQSNTSNADTDSSCTPLTSAPATRTTKVSNRQKQILARQARSRGAAAKLKTEKTKPSCPQSGSNKDNDNASLKTNKINMNGDDTVSKERRGSTGGLKYDGGGWQTSSDEDESSSDENDDSMTIAQNEIEQRNTDTSLLIQEEEELTTNLENEVDQLVCSWCSSQQNLITMIQTIPDIYTNENLPVEFLHVSYSSSPAEVRKAYLKIARYCHPDKQKRLVNAGQSERDRLIAAKLFSALADAYNAYKIQFDL